MPKVTMHDADDPFKLSRSLNKEERGQALDICAMILRVAEIEDELARRGADPLIKEMEGLKKSIKTIMLERDVLEVYEETSGYEAIIQQRSSETWNVATMKSILTPKQRGRYIVVQESVDTGAVADGVKNGDLSRAELEYKGAVTRTPGAKALYVRQRKETGDGLRA